MKGLVITIEVKCPVCGKVRKSEELLYVFKIGSDCEDTWIGEALITNCCKAVIVKNNYFDSVYLNNIDDPERRIINGIYVNSKPQLLRKRTIISPPPPSVEVEELALVEEKLIDQ